MKCNTNKILNPKEGKRVDLNNLPCINNYIKYKWNKHY